MRWNQKKIVGLYLCRKWCCCLFSLLCSDALACGSVPASVYFHCWRVKACIASWACEYAHTWVPSLNAQPFPGAGVCGSKSKCVLVCVCVCKSACASTLICKLNADLSIKADLACVLPTDMPVITRLFYCSPPSPRAWHNHEGRWRGTRTHTHMKTSNLIGMKEIT